MKNVRREDWELLRPTVRGWGINDVNYPVHKTEVINGKCKNVWVCPYYQKWFNMFNRAFNPKYHEVNPSYVGVKVCEEWRYLSNFIEWVDSQPNGDWKNCELDKDFLSSENKIYSPETAVFLPKNINSFITDGARYRGACMIGVNFTPSESGKNPYKAYCQNPFASGNGYIGRFGSELEAHLAWKAKKHKYACQLAENQKDHRVVSVLLKRYAPDTDWTSK